MAARFMAIASSEPFVPDIYGPEMRIMSGSVMWSDYVTDGLNRLGVGHKLCRAAPRGSPLRPVEAMLRPGNASNRRNRLQDLE